MEMEWYDGGSLRISDIKVHTEEGRVTLSFKWPNELEMVYVYKTDLLKNGRLDYDKPYRRYTKEEYQRFSGFVDHEAEGGMVEYEIYPYVRRNGEGHLIRYEDQCSRVLVNASRIVIRYELHERKKLLSHRKTVEMHIFCEVELPKNYIAYVKKKGAIPVSLKDGMRFDFIDDFHAGDNVLPEIEMDKDEYVRIYLSEEVPYKEAYKVIKG